ncbi:MAG: MipA/OmpV family protein [Pseudomonadota bacterium]
MLHPAVRLNWAILVVLAVTAFTTFTAMAQEDADGAAVAAATGVASGVGAPQPGWRSQWGIGVIANPKFAGADNYNITPIPYLDFRYMDQKGTKYFANIPQGIGGFFYRQRNLQTGGFVNIGASIAPGFTVRDDTFEQLDEVGISTEARIYAEAGGRNWVGAVTLAQDVGSGHEGAYIDLSLQQRGRLGDTTGFYAWGPVLRLGDDTYKEAFFNIPDDVAAEVGIDPYDADAGVERVGLQALISMPIGSSKWRVTSLARVASLIDDASDSPIVEEDIQYFFLAAFTRPF